MTVAASQTERPAIAKGAPHVPSDFLCMCRMGNAGRRRNGSYPPRCTYKNPPASWRAAVRALAPSSSGRYVVSEETIFLRPRSRLKTAGGYHGTIEQRNGANVPAPRQRNNLRAALSVCCLGNAWSKIMARNFGFHSPVRQNNPSPVWPMWVVAFVAIGVISAATLLPHH
jgi:hypothetical protein